MKLKFVIEKLPRPEQHGDWHDKPLRWIAKTADPVFVQKFSTKKDAELWRKCVRQSEGNFPQSLWQAAMTAYLAAA